MEIFSSEYIVLFIIIALGYLLGRISIKGISLDISAVIFIALIFGHYGFTIPPVVQNIGLLLFIFTVGIQAGPGFFDTFRQKGKQLIIFSLVLIVSASAVSVTAGLIFHIQPDILLGLLNGALTSTPGLAVSIDITGSNNASIGYGIAYPFGVVGVILFVRFIPKILKVNLAKEEERIVMAEKNEHPEITNQNFIIENHSIFNKSISELKIRTMTGAVISRLKQNNEVITPKKSNILREGDIVKGVGTCEALNKLELFLGSPTKEEIPLGQDYEVQSILVTNKEVVNKTIASLNLFTNYNANITRIRRSGIDISPDSQTHLKFGDKLTVACDKDNMKQVMKILGNDNKRLSDTDIFPIATGIILGTLLSQISLDFFGRFSFNVGLTGGVLLTAMILSYVGKTGNIIWTMSGAANQLLRQVGLLFFLAAVGTSAGANIVETYQNTGIKLFIIGAVITLLPMILATIFAHKVLKINFLILLGALAGSMTSTPGLAALDPVTENSAPKIAYATVYPFAMVVLIICVQLSYVVLRIFLGV